MIKVRDLRKSYLKFFEERGHKIVHSSSLVPKDDPTLLFATAGMVQFKAMFAGTVDLEYTRAASVQKCLRTSDLEQVGKTKRHCTFFEMLGNFSFGDYFKDEAIEFAWDYSTKVIGLPGDDIWISIYEDDDEAFDIWNKKIGIPEHKIIRLGKKDNFWGPAGDTGACGPCSELYIDRGEKFGCADPSCKPGCDCERFLEYWNNVFVQFNQDIDGNLNPLPQTGIDTGMGLERLAVIVQNTDSIYETDEMFELVNFVSKNSGVEYSGDNIIPIRVIVEHARTLTFSISDGVYPSNDGRGYVLRRVLRRAMRYCRQIGMKEPFIYKIVDPIVKIMGEFYPELNESIDNVKNVIESEEKRFLETLENGMDRLDEIIKGLTKDKKKTMPGNDAFVLYDTFGFPLEMTIEIAEEKGIEVNTDEFNKKMDEQRERGKQSWKGTDINFENIYNNIASEAGETEFTGYDNNTDNSKIQVLFKDNTPVDKISEGDNAIMIMDRTPFYGESGGQVGDRGEIKGPSGATFKIHDTKKHNKTIIHIGQVTNGNFSKGDDVIAEINSTERALIRANHTATHLLQRALIDTLGSHVKQAGSLVDPERFRFDFSHFNAMTDDEIKKVEEIVNKKIWEDIEVGTEISDLEEAVNKGALAVFDEKYEDEVRVVKIADYSMELCGGTHVSSTGQIGVFKILKEASPGAGMRRIEAVTLKGLLDRFNQQNKIVSHLSRTLTIEETGLIKKIEDLIEQNRSLEKENEKLKKETLYSDVDSIISNALEVNGVKIISQVFKNVDTNELRNISDAIRSKVHESIVIFGSDTDGKALLLSAATAASIEAGADSGKIIKEISKIVGGGGGGRKDLAQAGGKSPEKLNEAIEEGVKIAGEMIK